MSQFGAQFQAQQTPEEVARLQKKQMRAERKRIAESLKAEAEAVGKEFTKYYYETFAPSPESRKSLAVLYRDYSRLVFENKAVLGREDIEEYLEEMPFNVVQYIGASYDYQPMTVNETLSGLLIVVTGHLKVDDDPPKTFTQNFTLVQDGGNFAVVNDVLRFVYPME